MKRKWDFIHVSQFKPPAFGEYCRITIDLAGDECTEAAIASHAISLAADKIPWVGAIVSYQFEKTRDDILAKNKGYGVIVKLFLPVVGAGIAWNEVQTKIPHEDIFSGYISSLRIEMKDFLTLEKQIEDGWERIIVDLNYGAKGKYLYLNYKPCNTETELPISELKIITSKEDNIQTPAGYTKLPTDLNEGAGGDYIYLFYRTGNKAQGLKGIGIIAGDDPNITISNFEKIGIDLNKGAKGKYIYLCYLPATGVDTPPLHETKVNVKCWCGVVHIPKQHNISTEICWCGTIHKPHINIIDKKCWCGAIHFQHSIAKKHIRIKGMRCWCGEYHIGMFEKHEMHLTRKCWCGINHIMPLEHDFYIKPIR